MERDENSNGKRLIETILGDFAVCHLAGNCSQCGVPVRIRVSRDGGIENGTVFRTPASWYFSSKLIAKCAVCSAYNTSFRRPTDIFQPLELRCVGASMGVT